MKVLYGLILAFNCIQTDVYIENKQSALSNESMTYSKSDSMKLKITIGKKIITAFLYDNPTSRDFASLLPLTMELEDYNSTEKIGTLVKKLSTQNAPSGFDPSVGDITYYAPWGNLALFYKDFRYSDGLISLGRITSAVELFKVNGAVTVKIELQQ